MKTVKITEIKITAGKDVILLDPKSAQWVIDGKSGAIPDKLAAKLFKSIAGSAEQYFEIFRGSKLGDWKS